jgi:hypothetical protein
MPAGILCVAPASASAPAALQRRRCRAVCPPRPTWQATYHGGGHNAKALTRHMMHMIYGAPRPRGAESHSHPPRILFPITIPPHTRIVSSVRLHTNTSSGRGNDPAASPRGNRRAVAHAHRPQRLLPRAPRPRHPAPGAAPTHRATAQRTLWESWASRGVSSL